jgi:hypothetical protein
MLAGMKPSEICLTILKKEKLLSIVEELTNPQVKTVLKEGDVKVKLPSGYVTQQKRRELWSSKIIASVEQGNELAAAELLQQFLLNHRRQVLIDYLDRLEVKHRQGETDESFLVSRPKERLREAAAWLLEHHDRAETTAYLLYVAYQQRSTAFDDWPPLANRPAEDPQPVEPAPAAG